MDRTARFAAIFVLWACVFMCATPSAWAWVPTGATKLLARPQCRSEVLAKQIVDRFAPRAGAEVSFDTRMWEGVEELIQKFYDDCGDELRRSSLSNILEYTEMSLLTYDVKNHPQIQEVEFFFPEDGIVVRGLLALKKSKKPLPLVIFKCGLSCDLMDPSILYVLMVFFDMGPFHVLALPSNTGESFLKENRIYAVGGLEEGRQLVQIGRLIESGAWKYSDRVSRLHIFGMSLGGHAALYASLYADYLRERGQDSERDTKPLFSSVFAGCPVVDFKSALEHITGESFIARLLRKTILANIIDLLQAIPFFASYFENGKTTYNPSQEELRQMLVLGTHDYYKRKTDAVSWTMPPLEGVRFTTPETLWHWMNFSKEAIQKMRNPVFVWAPEDDDVVLYKENSKHLFEADASLPSRKIFKLQTKAGAHCAFPAIFGWSTSSVVMNAFFIARSPELLKEIRIETLPLPKGKFGPKDRASATHWRTDHSWIAVENKDYVTLRSTFREFPCRDNSRSPQRCVSVTQTRFTYAELGLDDSYIPKSSVEAHGFTRWLNYRLRFIEKNKQPLSKTGNPVAMRWIRFGEDGI
jgi:hypothetical protein